MSGYEILIIRNMIQARISELKKEIMTYDEESSIDCIKIRILELEDILKYMDALRR